MEKRRCARTRCRGRQDGRFEEEQMDSLGERQTPHRIGMLVALVPGSVRQIAAVTARGIQRDRTRGPPGCRDPGSCPAAIAGYTTRLHNSTPVSPSSAAKESMPSKGLNTSSGAYPEDGNPSPAPGLMSATSTGTPFSSL